MEGPLQALQQLAAAVLEIKRDADGEQPQDDALDALTAAGGVALVELREASRAEALAAEGLRDDTGGRRARLDHEGLGLAARAQEARYYQRQARDCASFVSAVDEAALGCAAPRVAPATPAAAAAAGPDAHAGELARLTDELERRKALAAELAALQERRAAAQRALGDAAARMDGLRGALDALSAGSRSLAEVTQPEEAAARANRDAARLLPLPLYVLYAAAAAGAAAAGLPVRASIEGNTAAAARLTLRPAVDADSDGGNAGGGGAGNGAIMAGGGGSTAKRRRKPEQQRASAELQQQQYQLHPLTVALDVLREPASYSSADGVSARTPSTLPPLLRLTFAFYTRLGVVGASSGVAEDDELLADLFVGDVGDGALLEAPAAVVAAAGGGGALQFGGPGRPRPFRWAQEVAGVDVLPSLPSGVLAGDGDRARALDALAAYRGELRLEALLERLAAAKRGRTALTTALDALARKEQPECSLEARLPGAVSTSIASWQLASERGGAAERRLLAGSAAALGHELRAWRPAAAPVPPAAGLREEGEVGGGGTDDAMPMGRLPLADEDDDLLLALLDPDDAAAAATAAESRGQQGSDADEGERAPSPVAGSDAESGDAEAGELALVGVGGGGGAAAARRAQLPARRGVFRLVLRSSVIEAHLLVGVFGAYPLLPPAFAVTRLLDVSRSGTPAPLASANAKLLLEQQAVRAVACASPPDEVLAVQVLLLRQAVDALSSHLRGDATKDPMERLRTKQQLRGRERQPRLLVA